MEYTNLEYLAEQIEKGNKLSKFEGTSLASDLLREKKRAIVIIKIDNERFKNWFNNRRNPSWTETLDEETTYVTSNTEKVFNSRMLGSSCFAVSIAELKREQRLGDSYASSIERVETLPYDWMLILEA